VSKYLPTVIVVVAVVVVAILVAVIYALINSVDTADKSPLLVAIASILATVILVAVIYALYRLLRWAIGLLISGVGLDDLPPVLILISLMLAATIFSAGANSVWDVIYGLARIVFVELPRSIIEVAFGTYACSSRGSSADCYFQVAANLTTGIARFFSDSFNRIGRVIDVLQFFGAWAIFAWVLRDFFAPSTADKTVGIHAFFSDIKTEARTRLAFTAIVAIAAYLCLCAIVAVSLFKPQENLQQIESKALESTALKTDLQEAKLSDAVFDKRFPEDLPAIPNADQFPRLATDYSELTSRWVQLRADIGAEQDRLLKIAVDNYKIKNLNRVGGREQANHYLALENWYQSSLNTSFNSLENCHTAILAVGTAINADIASAPAAAAAGSGNTGASSTRPVFSTGGISAIQRARQVCQLSLPDLADVPDRGDFGFALGIMGSLVGWLLRTESMPLAVITGLIGFGLFGALVSMFVRTGKDQVGEWAVLGVICRGVSAAIVVFLAAYGGIAIVSQNGGDPNPYVVFVTCLVGAVFSDEVWEWAKNKFVPRNGKDSEHAAGTDHPADADPHAADVDHHPADADQHAADTDHPAADADQHAAGADQDAAAEPQGADAGQQVEGESSGRRS
jgi:hypothetical protein